MKQLKLIMLILLSITIGSCYSIESDCGGDIGDFFWELTNGPPNGALSIVVARNGDIWTTTRYTGEVIFSTVCLSVNNGNTWAQKGYFWSSIVDFITISPLTGYIFVCNGSQGLFRSTNQGETWVKVTNNMDISSLLITESGEIYFGIIYSSFYPNVRGVYYSSNNGNTWIQKSNGLSNQNVLSLALGKDGTLYAGTDNGIYHSTNNGDNWLLSSNYTNVFVRGLAISDDGSIFATANNNGVLKSTDEGITWVQVNNGIDVGVHADRIIYNPITKDIFLSDLSYNSMVYRSSDLGESWELKNTGIPNEIYIDAFAFNHSTGQMYAATCNAGVYRSRNYP
jgi:photosystem II stability/assembly factor-like uncharacterized protein